MCAMCALGKIEIFELKVYIVGDSGVGQRQLNGTASKNTTVRI